VNRSGSSEDEPLWVSMHKYIETMLGISLYSYVYLKLAKPLCFSYYLYVFCSTKSEKKRAQQVLPGSGVGGPNNLYNVINVKQ
jgi:hypothetical protein